MSWALGLIRTCFQGWSRTCTVLLAVVAASTTGPLRAQQQSYTDEDAAACPGRAVLAFTSPYTNETYAGYADRGADSYFGRVYYKFTSIRSLSGKRTASGTFYLYGFECRLNQWLSPWGALMPPMERIEFSESSPLACAGTRPTDPVYSDAAFDPYADGGSTGGKCGESGSGGGDGDDGGGCHNEYVVIERSDNGGPWYPIWEGWAVLCG